MNDAEAWGGYWEQTGDSAGCLPGALDKVRTAFEDAWSDFGRSLPNASTVLDLACGTGAVLRSLLKANSSLVCTGVDSAPLPNVTLPERVSIICGDIEDLSLESKSFDAVTSQFGIEYANHEGAIAEAARVAKPDSRLQMVIHREKSPIARQNLRRLSALKEIDKAGAVEISRQCVAAGMNAAAPLRKTLLPIAAIFPDQSVVEEIGAALDYAARIGGAKGKSENDRIQNGIEREVTTLSALENAVIGDAEMDSFIELLSCSFGQIKKSTIVVAGESEPLAWLITAQRLG